MSDKAREKLIEIITTNVTRQERFINWDARFKPDKLADAILTEYVHKDELRKAIKCLEGCLCAMDENDEYGWSDEPMKDTEKFLKHAEKVLGEE